MKEKYTGPKFKTILEKNNTPYDEKIKELMFWCREFDKLNLAPLNETCSSGNLSFRSDNGFIITAAGKDMSKITVNDLVKVKKCNINRNEVEAVGITEPSSESFLHWFIYQNRKDINAIFHGHSRVILEKADKMNLIKTKRERPYGSIELAKEVLRVLDKNNYIVMTNHGFLSLGRTMKEAGELAIKICQLSLLRFPPIRR